MFQDFWYKNGWKMRFRNLLSIAMLSPIRRATSPSTAGLSAGNQHRLFWEAY